MAVERKLMTAEELERLPAGTGQRYELVDGELRTMAPAGGPHGESGGWTWGRVFRFVDDHGLGTVFMAETGFLLARDPDTVLAPDLAFVRTERMPAEGLSRGYVPVVPDLVLEVVSPSDTASEIRDKVQAWLDFGCRAVWVLYAEPRLDAFTPGGVRTYGPDDEVDGGDVLPGFKMKLSDMVRPTRRSQG